MSNIGSPDHYIGFYGSTNVFPVQLHSEVSGDENRFYKEQDTLLHISIYGLIGLFSTFLDLSS